MKANSSFDLEGSQRVVDSCLERKLDVLGLEFEGVHLDAEGCNDRNEDHYKDFDIERAQMVVEIRLEPIERNQDLELEDEGSLQGFDDVEHRMEEQIADLHYGRARRGSGHRHRHCHYLPNQTYSSHLLL